MGTSLFADCDPRTIHRTEIRHPRDGRSNIFVRQPARKATTSALELAGNRAQMTTSSFNRSVAQPLILIGGQRTDSFSQTCRSAKAMQHKLALFSATLAVLAMTSIVARPADDIKPPSGYRNWFHVNTMIVDKASPLFATLGGMHNVHVNSGGEPALKKGGPYPDGTMFVTDLHDFTVSDGSYVMGNLKGVAVMVKDAQKYAETGGWGFQFFAGGDANKPVVTDVVKQCFACHQPQKNQDYVYSTYIP